MHRISQNIWYHSVSLTWSQIYEVATYAVMSVEPTQRRSKSFSSIKVINGLMHTNHSLLNMKLQTRHNQFERSNRLPHVTEFLTFSTRWMRDSLLEPIIRVDCRDKLNHRVIMLPAGLRVFLSTINRCFKVRQRRGEGTASIIQFRQLQLDN